MGWAARAGAATAGRLAGLRVAIDVQHLYRPSKPNDQGTVFVGAPVSSLHGPEQHITEAHLSTIYALAMGDWFRARGATVYANDRARGILIGEYWTRNRQAASWGVHAYLACHVNAGGGRYAAVEYLAGTRSDSLALAIIGQFPPTSPSVPGLTGSRTVALAPGQRGAVCIESFHPGDLPATEPRGAVILEPFFGDTPQLRMLWGADQLQRIGWTIGEGVARWWGARARA